jgi:hypothetical protein
MILPILRTCSALFPRYFYDAAASTVPLRRRRKE